MERLTRRVLGCKVCFGTCPGVALQVLVNSKTLNPWGNSPESQWTPGNVGVKLSTSEGAEQENIHPSVLRAVASLQENPSAHCMNDSYMFFQKCLLIWAVVLESFNKISIGYQWSIIQTLAMLTVPNATFHSFFQAATIVAIICWHPHLKPPH